MVEKVEESCIAASDGYRLESRTASAGKVRAGVVGCPTGAAGELPVSSNPCGATRTPRRRARLGPVAGRKGHRYDGCLLLPERHVDIERGATPDRSGTRARDRREFQRRGTGDARRTLCVRG